MGGYAGWVNGACGHAWRFLGYVASQVQNPTDMVYILRTYDTHSNKISPVTMAEARIDTRHTVEQSL